MKNSTLNIPHIPVLPQEAVDSLRVKKGEKYIDATLGFGGHTKEILKKGGILLGIDCDGENLASVSKDLSAYDSNSWKLVQGNFEDIQNIAEAEGFGSVSGVLFDLGISSWQLDESKRGLSMRFDLDSEEKLDMRLDQTQEITAEYVVNKYSEKELYEVFSKYGELREAKSIARIIVKKRPIVTGNELVTVINSVASSQSLLARSFQALRIEVNHELIALKSGLAGAQVILKSGGVLAVISFHSLEDRLVKQAFNNWSNSKKMEIVTKQPITAGIQEVKANSRSKSAKLRIAIKK